MNRDKILEWSGVATAIVYSLIVAMNIDLEFVGFTLLLFKTIKWQHYIKELYEINLRV